MKKPRHHGTEWTPIMDARLQELHAESHTFLAISRLMSAEFELTLTRGACIGRSHRLSLKARDTSVVTRRVRKAKPRKTIAPPLAPAPLPRAGTYTMAQLTSHVCHWPSGDRPPYVYCGAPTHEGSSFCREHYRLAYPSSALGKARQE